MHFMDSTQQTHTSPTTSSASILTVSSAPAGEVAFDSALNRAVPCHRWAQITGA
jgi:hypothetical protein